MERFAMDEIETGFARILEKIEQEKKNLQVLTETVRTNDTRLLERMAGAAIPVIQSIGITLLEKGKQDLKGELYDPKYFEKKMIVLGKTEPAPFRPDNPEKRVTDQFCVLSEEGKFFEIMYSSDGFVTDSYLNILDAKTVLEIYGYDAMFMLYKAMHDFLKGEEALISALETTIAFVFDGKPE
jgi:hypothetical protein